jgi:uncharacterized membrane protein YdjX (TVP38/TMEM64 family)
VELTLGEATMTNKAGLRKLLPASSLLLLFAGAVLLLRALPVEAAFLRLEGVTEALGWLGLVAYGVAYTLAALAFVPGSAMTLGAGAIFGPLRGLAVVSVAATAAAALAFLIARHLARHRVESLARSYPRFRAVDRAIAEGGWKVVALLRLSPAMPFSAGNYLFGLTAVGFWPYVLASWAAMLPGTFLYVYLGHAGRVAAAGSGRTPAEWAFLGAGLLATVAVTVYVTRLARRGMPAEERTAAGATAAATPDAGGPVRAKGLGWRLPAAAVASLAVGLWAHANAERLRYAFGPPPVSSAEAYASAPGSASFDQSRLDVLLRTHVDADGLVDYARLKGAHAELDAYIGSLAGAPFEKLGRDEKLALLINAYNAFTLRLVLDHWPVASIQDIPTEQRWDARRWRLAGETLSLNQIENERIRPMFLEPRIHFALVCAARGCPPLRAEAYTGARLESQLLDQARRVHSDDHWLRFDPSTGELRLTELYKWYESDFRQASGSVPEHVALHAPPVRAALDAGQRVEVHWIPYDWSLNEKR